MFWYFCGQSEKYLIPEEVVAVSLVDGMSEVMGMLSVLVDKDGMTGVLVGMVNIVVSSGPVVTHSNYLEISNQKLRSYLYLWELGLYLFEKKY